MDIKDRQERINQWVEDIVSDDWLDNMKSVVAWREVAVLVGPEKTRDELVRLLEGRRG